MKLSSNGENKSSLGQIQNKSLREHVLAMLNAAIINGELKPGTTLIEADLAAQLGVSRAPIREAINTLAAQGLVEIVPYHGTTVKKLSRKDIEELYSIRSLMEAFAIQRIIEAGSPPTALADLRAVCAIMLEAAKAGDLSGVNRIDRDFHDTLVYASRHDLLIQLWGTVSLRVRQVMSLRNSRKGNLFVIAENHFIIVDTIERGNVDEAVKLIHHHIGSAADLLVEGWAIDDLAIDGNGAPSQENKS
jgi:DNA-binding GntR family transcriptional regulator